MVLHLFNAIEVISTQPFRSNSSVVALYISVLLRLSRLDIDQPDPGLLRLGLKAATDVFRSVVDAYRQGLPAPGNDLFQRPHDTF